MQSRVYVTVHCPSVRLSVRLFVSLFHLLTAACRCGGFAAVVPVGRKYRSIAAGRRTAATAPQQHGEQQNGGQQQRRAVLRLQPP